MNIIEMDICSAPQAITDVESAFNNFYKSYKSELAFRKIDWLYGEGSVEIIGEFEEGKKNLLVSVPQYAVLDCLQNANPQMKLSVEEIQQKVNFSNQWLAMIFQPLLELEVLKREKNENDELKQDEFVWINTKFSSENEEINLIGTKPIMDRDSEEEAKKIDSNKMFKIEAAIIRIMKSKKIANFNDLAIDVRNFLQNLFQPCDKMLRISIDDLIQKGYIERDDNDMNIFHYKP